MRREETLGIHLDQRPLPRAFPFNEHVDVLLAGEKEFQETDPFVPTRLAEAKKHQVILQALLFQTAAPVLPVIGEALDGILGIIVVPRHPVVLDEGKPRRLLPEMVLFSCNPATFLFRRVFLTFSASPSPFSTLVLS